MIPPLLGNALPDTQPAPGAELGAVPAVLPEARTVPALPSAAPLVSVLGGWGTTSYLLAITGYPSSSFPFGCH